jgi:hypothetical protein
VIFMLDCSLTTASPTADNADDVDDADLLNYFAGLIFPIRVIGGVCGRERI